MLRRWAALRLSTRKSAQPQLFIFMPNHLAASRKLDLSPTLLLSAAALVVTAIAAVALGRLSDIVGRRPVAIWSSLALVVLATPMSILAGTSQTGLLLAQLIIGAAFAGVLLIAMVGRAVSNSAASEWAGDDRWPCYGAGRRHGTCGGSDPGLTLAPDLDQIDAGIPQCVNESPERCIV